MEAEMNEGNPRDRLIEQYHGFVEHVVRFVIRTTDVSARHYDELVSAGYIGLVEAAERFDPRRNKTFRSYAFFRVRGAVIDYVRSACRVPGSAYHRLQGLAAAHDVRAGYSFEQPSTKGDPAGSLALLLNYAAESALALQLSAEGRGAEDAVVDSRPSPEEKAVQNQTAVRLRGHVANLPEKERLIVTEYYFHGKPFTQIADENPPLSKSWVSRLHARALATLREAIGSKEALI